MIIAMAGHRFFAAIYDRLMKGTEEAGLAKSRAALLASASGRTLELGAGTGANAAHYRAGVSELVLSEPDPHMARRLRAKLAENPPPVPYEVIEAGAELLPFDDASFDTVVSTLVLCTVDDADRAAAEIKRVLRPGGQLLLFEHVRDPQQGRLGRWQDRLERPWGWFAGGCHPNRDTAATLRAAGFDVTGLQPAELPKVAPIVVPAITGSVSSRPLG
jgi:ubiquinone/menaquinone biosynthesis C-methylase UbiE